MEMQEFAERRIGQLKQEDMKIRQTLYEEITKAVRDHALKTGYDMIFDKTGVSLSTVPVLVFVKDGSIPDVTNEIIVELNKDAPAKKPEAAAPAPAPTK
jgi:outer membrane protein